MASTDSFIAEVSEEVRRDRLFALFRKYGWIPVVLVVCIVGGVAVKEFVEARSASRAQDLGDRLIAASEVEDEGERADAYVEVFESLPSDKSAAGGRVVAGFLTAEALLEVDRDEEAGEILRAVADTPGVSEFYSDLARFKSLLALDEVADASERKEGFEGLAEPGSPLRLLAEEQLALIAFEDGMVDEAIEALEAILEDAEVTSGQERRVQQLVDALKEPEVLDPDEVQELLAAIAEAAEAEEEASNEPQFKIESSVSVEPQSTSQPQVTIVPQVTTESQDSTQPQVTIVPQVTTESQDSTQPQVTIVPQVTTESQDSTQPQVTIVPQVTTESQDSAQPQVTIVPQVTTESQDSTQPQITIVPVPDSGDSDSSGASAEQGESESGSGSGN